ncbi:hypothetical protein EI94DRAFT_858563 [Lactarius quietus]|nr:hypothetical protein EI94DRAFT_858563 [Lactarius quietus]
MQSSFDDSCNLCVAVWLVFVRVRARGHRRINTPIQCVSFPVISNGRQAAEPENFEIYYGVMREQNFLGLYHCTAAPEFRSDLPVDIHNLKLTGGAAGRDHARVSYYRSKQFENNVRNADRTTRARIHVGRSSKWDSYLMTSGFRLRETNVG